MLMYRWLLCLMVSLACACPAWAQPTEDPTAWWPQLLGPRRDGISHERGLNLDWRKTPPKVLWKVSLGKAFSSLSIVGNRVFTMAKRGTDDCAVCLDAASGKELWAVPLAPSYIDKQKQGAGPRATPTYHEGRLYCLLPMGELFCLSAADGKKIWSANEFKDTDSKNPEGATFFYWGASLSPLIEGDLVIVQPGGSNNNSVAAYHKDTGKLVWTIGNDAPGYSSPIAVTIDGQRQLIVPAGSAILGIDPAKPAILWRYPFGNTYNVTCANPVWQDDLLLVSAAYGAGSAALEITRKDGQWSAREKWKNKQSLQALFSTPIVVDGHAYGINGDLGTILMKCIDLKTGEVRWSERMPNRQFLLAVDGHLLSWGERGTLSLVEMQPQKYVKKGELPDLLTYKCWAAPALAEGRLYLRDETNALCLDLRLKQQ
jgi:outer membrane protein assembly factor BamB